jgi:hypothetical protein
MRVNDSPHLSVKPESVALKYLEEKEEEYMYLREAHDKLTDALSDDEKIPAEISEKLKRLGDQLEELKQLLKDYRNFLKDVYI